MMDTSSFKPKSMSHTAFGSSVGHYSRSRLHCSLVHIDAQECIWPTTESGFFDFDLAPRVHGSQLDNEAAQH